MLRSSKQKHTRPRSEPSFLSNQPFVFKGAGFDFVFLRIYSAMPGLAQTPFPRTKFPPIPIPLIHLRPIRTPFESLLHKKYLDKLSRVAVTYSVNIAFQPAPSSHSGTCPLPAPRIPPHPRTLCALCVSASSWSSFFSRQLLAPSLEGSLATRLPRVLRLRGNSPTRRNSRNSIPFIALLHNLRTPPGGGVPSLDSSRCARANLS
jgi:hypothetical protein